MEYPLNQSLWQNVFCVPAAAVDRCLASASGDEVKVLLAVLRCREESVSSRQIAKISGVREDAVDAAVAYWVEQKILPAQLIGAVPPVAIKQETRKTAVSAPQLTAAEIGQMVKSDSEIAFLLQSAEALYGRPVTSTEQRGLVSLREWMGMPVDVILMVVKYCLGNGKGSIRYIEKTAASWFDEGIRTHEAAEAYLQSLTQRAQSENKIKSLFGIRNRNLSTNEKRYIQQWVREYGYGSDMIRQAYEISVDRIGSLSFPYINKILASWHEKGYRTPEEARQENGKKSSTSNGNGSFDINEFEDMGIFEIPDVKGE